MVADAVGESATGVVISMVRGALKAKCPQPMREPRMSKNEFIQAMETARLKPQPQDPIRTPAEQIAILRGELADPVLEGELVA